MATRVTIPGTHAAGETILAADHNKTPGGWLGYVEVTAAQTGITAETDLTGLTVTVSVNSSRRIRITGAGTMIRTVADGYNNGWIKEGATFLGSWGVSGNSVTYVGCMGSAIVTPTGGSHTYKLTLQRATGTGTVALHADSAIKAFLLVEDIGPAT